jgi:hypothetical protein
MSTDVQVLALMQPLGKPAVVNMPRTVEETAVETPAQFVWYL